MVYAMGSEVKVHGLHGLVLSVYVTSAGLRERPDFQPCRIMGAETSFDFMGLREDWWHMPSSMLLIADD